MSNRAKGISLAVITAVMWGIMGIFVRSLSQYQFTNLEISFSAVRWLAELTFCFCFLRNHPH